MVNRIKIAKNTDCTAAKKPALSKTKVSVYTGKKAKVSIKKIAKKTDCTTDRSDKKHW